MMFFPSAFGHKSLFGVTMYHQKKSFVAKGFASKHALNPLSQKLKRRNDEKSCNK